MVDVVNLFYRDTAEHDAYDAVARRFDDIRANVGEYPPIIAASIQRIIRDEAEPDTELYRLLERREVDVNRLSAVWDRTNRPLNPRVTMLDLERSPSETALMTAGCRVVVAVGKHRGFTVPKAQLCGFGTGWEAYALSDVHRSIAFANIRSWRIDRDCNLDIGI